MLWGRRRARFGCRGSGIRGTFSLGGVRSVLSVMRELCRGCSRSCYGRGCLGDGSRLLRVVGSTVSSASLGRRLLYSACSFGGYVSMCEGI